MTIILILILVQKSGIIFNDECLVLTAIKGRSNYYHFVITYNALSSALHPLALIGESLNRQLLWEHSLHQLPSASWPGTMEKKSTFWVLVQLHKEKEWITVVRASDQKMGLTVMIMSFCWRTSACFILVCITSLETCIFWFWLMRRLTNSYFWPILQLLSSLQKTAEGHRFFFHLLWTDDEVSIALHCFYSSWSMV